MEGAETSRQRACPSCPCVWILGMKPCAALAARLLSASWPSSATRAPASCPSKMRAASAASVAPRCGKGERLSRRFQRLWGVLAASQTDAEINPSQGSWQICRCQVDCRLGMLARAVKWGGAAYRVTGAALGGRQN